MAVRYLVCSEMQRRNKRGCHAVTFSLPRAVDRAVAIAQKQRRRMYVVAIKVETNRRSA